MPSNEMTKERAEILADLEYIIGTNCYNGSIQNYGPGGVYYGEGRTFRYPLTVMHKLGEPHQVRSPAIGFSPDVLASGYYAFGANRLHIISALDELLRHLESNYGLKLPDNSNK